MDGLSRTKHLVWGAVIVALCSFAYAKGPGMPHGGASFGADSYGHGNYVNRDVGRNVERNLDPSGASSPGMHRVAGPGAYPGDGRGGIPYVGVIQPVSAETRPGQRPQSNAPVRSGSIRADVARYNEERGSLRAVQRQGDDSRPPESSPYRN
ncbi:hypothetical protein [Paraburkholderia kirstenboschensis]|uniref:Peptide-binding protein n=1 Tax=Paraburkholderia kirstenboschensis TaxID=1245436 RepID=A0ABZ0ELX2_9BURK|nr:hypothetical protein [Paraburkholderia kirstenboschensis]WOD18175.1 hypothetical protein RW095_36035 [Paraburkholderia kirstenboschensis]